MCARRGVKLFLRSVLFCFFFARNSSATLSQRQRAKLVRPGNTKSQRTKCSRLCARHLAQFWLPLCSVFDFVLFVKRSSFLFISFLFSFLVLCNSVLCCAALCRLWCVCLACHRRITLACLQVITRWLAGKIRFAAALSEKRQPRKRSISGSSSQKFPCHQNFDCVLFCSALRSLSNLCLLARSLAAHY